MENKTDDKTYSNIRIIYIALNTLLWTMSYFALLPYENRFEALGDTCYSILNGIGLNSLGNIVFFVLLNGVIGIFLFAKKTIDGDRNMLHYITLLIGILSILVIPIGFIMIYNMSIG